MWKIEGIVSKGVYNYAIVKDHPNSNKFGYVLEHRIVMENSINRTLSPNEVVHHINGDQKDNSLPNLMLMTRKDHSALHSSEQGRQMATLRCPNCSGIFDKYLNQTHISKGGSYSCCSNKCKGSFSRYIQLNGKTPEVEQAISGNIVGVYNTSDNPEQTIDNGMRRDYTPVT